MNCFVCWVEYEISYSNPLIPKFGENNIDPRLIVDSRMRQKIQLEIWLGSREKWRVFFSSKTFFSPESSFNEIERKRFENEGGARVRNDFGTWS